MDKEIGLVYSYMDVFVVSCCYRGATDRER